MNNKANEWAFRLQFELKRSLNAYFVTLTYDDEHLPYITNDQGVIAPGFDKKGVQKFIKRLRKRSSSKIKYYLTSEYGDNTYRPHYHAIVFNLDCNDPQNTILNAWKQGNVMLGSVTPASIRYVTKYALKGSEIPRGQIKPFRLQSTRLGDNYIKERKKWHIDDNNRFYSVREDGIKISLPRYYKNKIYNEQIRKQFANKCNSHAAEEEEKEIAKYYAANPRAVKINNQGYYQNLREKVIDADYKYKQKLKKQKL